MFKILKEAHPKFPGDVGVGSFYNVCWLGGAAEPLCVMETGFDPVKRGVTDAAVNFPSSSQGKLQCPSPPSFNTKLVWKDSDSGALLLCPPTPRQGCLMLS